MEIFKFYWYVHCIFFRYLRVAKNLRRRFVNFETCSEAEICLWLHHIQIGVMVSDVASQQKRQGFESTRRRAVNLVF